MIRESLLMFAVLSFGSLAVAAPTPPPPPAQEAPKLVPALLVSDEANAKIAAHAVDGSVVVTSPPQSRPTDPKKLSAEIVFDTSKEKTDVRKRVAELEALRTVDPHKHNRPPIVMFTWLKQASFAGIIESMAVKYTLFLADGTPSRATVSLHMHEASRCTSDAVCAPSRVCRTGVCVYTQ